MKKVRYGGSSKSLRFLTGMAVSLNHADEQLGVPDFVCVKTDDCAGILRVSEACKRA